MDSRLPIALHIMGFLASRQGEALTSTVMARTYGTSPVVLRRVLARLQKAGLVHTQRGAGGGSVLARDANTINLRQVYEAISDDARLMPLFPTDCSGKVAPILADYVNELFADAEEALLATLGESTVAEMDRHVRGRIRRALHCDPER